MSCPSSPQLAENLADVNHVPGNDGVDHEPQRPQLILLALAVPLP
jgi:hypothetical protein